MAASSPPKADSIEHAMARINSLQEQMDEMQAKVEPAPRPPPMSVEATSEALSLRVLGPKLLTEFIGTAFLTMMVGMTAKSNPQAPLCIGGILVALVYMGGHISGAHYNPTVSIAVWCRGKSTLVELLAYIFFQIVGGFAGAGVARGFTGADGFGYPTFHYYWHAAIAEFVWSLLLAMVVLHSATSGATVNNSFFGLAIGFTVFAGAVVVGPISGGAFNTAVGLALPIVAGDAAKCWMYVVMPPLGGAAAGLLFHFTSPDDFKARFKSSAVADLVASCLMEAFATFYLVLYVALLPYHTNHPLSPIALFALTSALIFMAGPVSGGHINPAVTVAVYTRFKFGLRPSTRALFRLYKLALYIFAQLVGAITAAGVGCTLTYTNIVRPTGFPLPPNPSRYGQLTAFCGELLGTFLLALIVLNVATVKKTEGNSYFGMAIGAAIAAISTAIGPITGGCLNPAVALLTAVRGAFPAGFSFAPLWVYYVACPLGGFFAAIVFRVQNLDDYDEFFAADVAKRYSVMTSGLEEDNQYHKQGRLNDAGEHAKRATIATQRASLNRASVQRGGTAMPPPGPPPMADQTSSRIITMSAA